METTYKSQKLEWCKDELKMLLEKLIAGNYSQTADVIFSHVAHTGVETDLDPELKHTPTLTKFLEDK